MPRKLRLVRAGETVAVKPHLNIPSLQRKAASSLHHIASSGFASYRYSEVWVRYLRTVLEKLQDENPSPVYELREMELDLEAIEAGMIHMNITSRPVEVLFLPRELPPEMIDRLGTLKQKVRNHAPILPSFSEEPANLIRLRKSS
ncbi:MAG: hypothetical protein Q7S00_01980 [bacterium]|nr:hypothetical protein [bacterium]